VKSVRYFPLVSLFLLSCVSVQKFDAQQAELDACRAQAENDALATAELRRNLHAVTQERDACVQEVALTRESAADLEQRADQLRLSLQEEILARNVEIEALKDKLSVRVLDRILFRSGSAQILPQGEAVLDKLAAVLGNTDEYIRVEGHTDSVPISERLKARYFSNWELSAARASSVVRFFAHRHQIDPLRMEAVGFSQYRPVATGKSAADLQRNRRVEIVLTRPLVHESAAAE